MTDVAVQEDLVAYIESMEHIRKTNRYVDIPDEAGAIASLATLLAKADISIKNIGIIHNRDFEEGVLRIEFYEQSSLEEAITLLKKLHYSIYQRK